MTDAGLPPLIPLEEAQERVLRGVTPLPVEHVRVEDAAGRVLAGAVRSALTVPPWDNSAMDGFAVRSADVAAASADVPAILRVLGEIPAGGPADDAVEPGTALRIMTGAMIPAGADAVVPVEDTDAAPGQAALPGEVAVRAAAPVGANIRRAGSDVRAGAPLLPAGFAMGPAAVALLGATGHATVEVHRRPRVAVVSTGDELVPARRAARPGPDLRQQRPRARRPGARRRRRGPPARHRPRHAAGPAGAPGGGGGVGRRRGPERGRLGGRPRPREDGLLHARHDVPVAGRDQARAPVRLRPGSRRRARRGALRAARATPSASSSRSSSSCARCCAPWPAMPGSSIARCGGPGSASRCGGRRAALTVARVVLEPDPARPDGLVARSSGGQDSYMLGSLAAANGLAFLPDLAPGRGRGDGLGARGGLGAGGRRPVPRLGHERRRPAGSGAQPPLVAGKRSRRSSSRHGERRIVEPDDLAVEPAPPRRRPRARRGGGWPRRSGSSPSRRTSNRLRRSGP